MKLKKNGMYYFTPREWKYTNRSRPTRKVSNGYRKATGADKVALDKGKKIEFKKTLVFHEGKPPSGSKTNWIMHEYVSSHAPVRVRHGKEDMKLDNWVLCKLYKNSREEKQKRRTPQEGNGLECQEKVEADIAAIVPNKMAAAISEPINMVAPPGSSVTGQSAKPVTIAQDVPHGGLSIRWGIFSPRELARFRELLEKPIRLKPGWPDNEDMAT
ncbi:hypothetical protein Goklo_000904 [Gossypium klotzschianum]|uniref:NAC domain-containing protein n=1 Tax=Gossypium klotzschianum TaxID=34286 RepID=A0A7J8VYP9_9ROSI|nr:hypothetical protein [Gossypium klotzschianum]